MTQIQRDVQGELSKDEEAKEILNQQRDRRQEEETGIDDMEDTSGMRWREKQIYEK